MLVQTFVFLEESTSLVIWVAKLEDTLIVVLIRRITSLEQQNQERNLKGERKRIGDCLKMCDAVEIWSPIILSPIVSLS